MAWLVIGGLILFGICCITLGISIKPDKTEERAPTKRLIASQPPRKAPKVKSYATVHALDDYRVLGELTREEFDARLVPFRERIRELKQASRKIRIQIDKTPERKTFKPNILAEAQTALEKIAVVAQELDELDRSIMCETDGGDNKIIKLMETLHDIEADIYHCISEIEDYEPDE